jgi:hypothetical protein
VSGIRGADNNNWDISRTKTTPLPINDPAEDALLSHGGPTAGPGELAPGRHEQHSADHPHDPWGRQRKPAPECDLHRKQQRLSTAPSRDPRLTNQAAADTTAMRARNASSSLTSSPASYGKPDDHGPPYTSNQPNRLGSRAVAEHEDAHRDGR